MKTQSPCNLLSISQEHITLAKLKETGLPLYRQQAVAGLSTQGMVKSLTGLVKSFALKGREFVVLLPRKNVLMTSVVLPTVDPVEIKQMITLLIPTLSPYAEHEVIFDVHTIESAGGSTKVLVVIVPKEIVESQWKLCVSAGITPKVLTVSSFAIWSWYRARSTEKAQTVLLLDVSKDDIEICICSAQSLKTSRVFHYAAADFNLNGPDVLFREIDMTVQEYTKQSLGPLPLRIVIACNAPIRPEMIDTLRKEYQLPVENVVLGNDLVPTPVSFAMLMGAAHMDRRNIVELLPHALLQTQIKIASKVVFQRIIVWAGILVLILMGMINVHLHKKDALLEQYQQEWRQIKQALGENDKITTRINAIKNVLNRYSSFGRIFNSIQSAAPQGLSLFNINLSGDKTLTMQGVALQQADINAFADGLMRGGLFANVRLDFVSKRVVENAEQSYFKITSQIK